MTSWRLIIHFSIVLTMLAVALPTLAATPMRELTLGSAPGAVDLASVPESRPHGRGWAIPLKAAQPDWYTPQLERRVRVAAGEPVPAPSDGPLPSEVGIRPGAWMIAPTGCTMNFVFERGGDLAIGTAGHCVDHLGQRVVLLVLPPPDAPICTPGPCDDPVLIDVGTVIARHNNGIGDDFALVRIRDKLRSWVSATTAVIAGPCGRYGDDGLETVAHYGHGTAIGTGGTPRAGVALTWKADAFGWDGAALFGDSGSPVRITDLAAAGNLTHLVVNQRWQPSVIAGTRIAKMLRIARGWSLLDSPACLDPVK